MQGLACSLPLSMAFKQHVLSHVKNVHQEWCTYESDQNRVWGPGGWGEACLSTDSWRPSGAKWIEGGGGCVHDWQCCPCMGAGCRLQGFEGR
eukprot:scaffold26848_cov14-Tisochrysis_lutea.AAC.1